MVCRTHDTIPHRQTRYLLFFVRTRPMVVYLRPHAYTTCDTLYTYILILLLLRLNSSMYRLHCPVYVVVSVYRHDGYTSALLLLRMLWSRDPVRHVIHRKTTPIANNITWKGNARASVPQLTMLGPFSGGCVLGIRRGHVHHSTAALTRTADHDNK